MKPSVNDQEKASQLWCLPKHENKVMDPDFAMSIAQALADARREVLNDILEEVSKIYHLPCKQKEHDDRWCSYCENRRDGMDIVTDLIEKNRDKN